MSLVKKLYKSFNLNSGGSFTLDIPQWEIPDSGITVVSGPSGSGKTTLFKILIGLEECKGMSWVHDGEDLSLLPVEKRRLGVVFQGENLFPHMSAAENILFSAQARGVSKHEAQKKINNLVEQLKLKSCIDSNTSVLSGGEYQRVSLARALVGAPRVLLLDEPFSALDTDTRKGARELVKDIVQLYNIPTLLITHDDEDTFALADTVVKINQGRIQ